MAIGLGKRLTAAREISDESSARTADGHRCRKRAPRPGEGTPKGSAHMLALCTTPGQLAYFVALALQQHGQQPALRKRKGVPPAIAVAPVADHGESGNLFFKA